MFHKADGFSVHASEVAHATGTYRRIKSPNELNLTNVPASFGAPNHGSGNPSRHPSATHHQNGGSGMFTGARDFSVAAASVVNTGRPPAWGETRTGMFGHASNFSVTAAEVVHAEGGYERDGSANILSISYAPANTQQVPTPHPYTQHYAESYESVGTPVYNSGTRVHNGRRSIQSATHYAPPPGHNYDPPPQPIYSGGNLYGPPQTYADSADPYANAPTNNQGYPPASTTPYAAPQSIARSHSDTPYANSAASGSGSRHPTRSHSMQPAQHPKSRKKAKGKDGRRSNIELREIEERSSDDEVAAPLPIVRKRTY
ncbi:hypothetical protein B0H19DRAFT_1157927 [Mycena capillaripes]|nr:hypothetical protein B0H19DRAFT_1157927 [Mycena capillaripes]